MINQRLVNCVDCVTIPNLLDDIDCKLTELAKKQYNNTIFALNYPLQGTVWLDLLNYKRILTYKYCNPEYACDYSIDKIASKVKILIFK